MVKAINIKFVRSEPGSVHRHMCTSLKLLRCLLQLPWEYVAIFDADFEVRLVAVPCWQPELGAAWSSHAL
jgi:hypothetical protein